MPDAAPPLDPEERNSAEKERWFLNNWCDAKGTPGDAYPDPPPEPKGALGFPYGLFTVWADDDDVIGEKVAETYPHGLNIIQTNPACGGAFDETDVAEYLAWALSNRDRIIQAVTRG